MIFLSEAMSEFKYACPVCGQHIKCDSSQSGKVMDCPTCFQKHIAPQAPASSDSKIILTGQKLTSFSAPSQKYGERGHTEPRIPTTPGQPARTPSVEPAKRFPVAVVVVMALVLAAGAGVFVFRGQIFKSGPSQATGTPAATAPQPVASASPAAPAEAPAESSASDTNWMLDLTGVTFPSGPVTGRIHGQDFVCTRATFQNGSLVLRALPHGPFEFGATIDFSGEQPEVMAGKSFNISNSVDRAAKITLRWKENGEVKRAYFRDSYVMRLDFGALDKTHLPGKIYLCTPDEQKSYLMGTFDADARKPKPKEPKS